MRKPSHAAATPDAPIIVRPDRSAIAFVCLSLFGAGAAIVIRWGFSHLDGVAYMGVAVVGAIHYLSFYYYSLDPESIRIFKYFGLVKRTIRISRLTGAEVEEEFNFAGMGIPVLRLNYDDTCLRLNSSRLSAASIAKVAAVLPSWGVPVQGDLAASIRRGVRYPWQRRTKA